MVSLVIYSMAFLVVIGLVGTITYFFNSNLQDINSTANSNAAYNLLNVYLLHYTQNGYTIYECSEEGDEPVYVTVSNGSQMNTFVLLGNVLYFNQTKLCDNVNDFQVEHTIATNGKDVLKTYVDINGTVYTTDYVVD